MIFLNNDAEVKRDKMTSVQQYVETILREAHERKYEDKDHNAFVKPNLLLYCYLLQYKDYVVSRRKLRMMMGTTQAPIAEYILSEEFRKNGLIKEMRKDIIVLNDDSIDIIQQVYDSEEFSYHLAAEIPFLEGGLIGLSNKITGIDFLVMINSLDEGMVNSRVLLTKLLADGFSRALPEIEVSVPYPEDANNVMLLSGPNKVWNFLFSVYPTTGPMNTEEINICVRDIVPIREWLRVDQKLPDLPALVVGPIIDDEEVDLTYWSKLRFAYHLWPIAYIRFMHMLEKLTSESGEKTQSSKSVIAERFIEILHAPKVSATMATELLKKKLDKQ